MRNMDTYVLIPSKYKLLANVAADRATTALEEFTTPIKKPPTKQIPFKTTSINKAIKALTVTLSPKRATTTKKIVVPPRVGTNQRQAGPRVNNKRESKSVLRP